MSADVVERAESAIARGFVLPESLGLTRELIDALKAARKENGELRAEFNRRLCDD